MNCPGCSADLAEADLQIAGTVGVCPQCARSLVLEFGDVVTFEGQHADVVRFATSEDLLKLSDAQVTALRKARPESWRQAVKATKARIKGR